MPVKGVILAAGYGTRFLPVARCVPKEMLPIVDRPAIDYVVQEMIGAGIEEILVITSRRKRAIEDWFDRDPELEAVFAREEAHAKLALSRPPPVKVTFIRQIEMAGTGQALLLARNFAGADPVVLAFPDDLFGDPNCSAELVATWRKTGCSVLSAVDLEGQDVSRYGVMDVRRREDGELGLRSIVEKPKRGREPSTLVSLGRYLYTPEIFAHLEAGLAKHDPSRGEFFATEAVNRLAEAGRVVARVVQAERYDTGTPLGYLQTVVEATLLHPELKDDFRAWLQARLAT